jgi:hypothetical protein
MGPFGEDWSFPNPEDLPSDADEDDEDDLAFRAA